jgi:hypothetical protein
VKHLGPRTIYLLSALATVVLVAAAALAASGIDIGRPNSADLPLLVARSASRPAESLASTVPTVAAPAPLPPPAPGPSPAPAGEGDSRSGGAASSGSRRSSTTAAHSVTIAPPPVVVTPPHGHEIVTPPVRESNGHHRGGTGATPKSPTPHH